MGGSGMYKIFSVLANIILCVCVLNYIAKIF